MGYTTVSTSIFPQDMPFNDANLSYVIGFSGWTVKELAAELGINFVQFGKLKHGLDSSLWRRLLDVCGKRAFDHDGESL